MKIDLHIHSSASDGTLAPESILELARRRKLGAIAITDHDTVDGIRALLRHPPPADIHLLSGVEISAAPPPLCPPRGSFHILGYGIDVRHAGLESLLQRLQHARRDRNPRIIRRLHRLGLDLDLESAAAVAGGLRHLGRPHIARLMVQRGFAADIDEAFDRYLGYGRPAYVDKYRVPCREAIGTIRDAGGLAVLAHPGITLGADLDLEAVLAELVAMGVEGIEARYPGHDRGQTRRYEAAARRFDLLVTGGSDFHGDIKPDIALGTGAGDLDVPIELYDRLVAALAGRRPAPPDAPACGPR